MKNIHVLPTDKPTYLYKFEGKLYLSEKFEKANKFWNNQNIYITSDEEPKHGEWCIDIDKFWDTKPIINIAYEKNICPENTKQLKIILTTDQDLIKYGVQAIDDEFLEWFVKNPNCEEVKVKYNEGIYDLSMGYPLIYKIIIPKEEFKQIKCYCGHTDYCDCGPLEEPKQETLEEAAEKHINDDLDLYESLVDGHISYNIGIDLLNKLFKDGAKWQAERMYSEEEVFKLLCSMPNFFNMTIPQQIQARKEWFEQFKK